MASMTELNRKILIEENRRLIRQECQKSCISSLSTASPTLRFLIACRGWLVCLQPVGRCWFTCSQTGFETVKQTKSYLGHLYRNEIILVVNCHLNKCSYIYIYSLILNRASTDNTYTYIILFSSLLTLKFGIMNKICTLVCSVSDPDPYETVSFGRIRVRRYGSG